MGLIFATQYPEYNMSYSISHVLHGACIYLFRSGFLFWWAVWYQALQYALHVRVYIPDRTIRLGHNTRHLINKLAEYYCGYLLVRTIRNMI
jgi:hypothetical protein